jgi:dTDP-4-dehydrorhamnose 3,5-epimerase
MIIKEAGLRGVFEITLEPYKDHRGFFMRTYDVKIFKGLGLHRDWVQENHSYSKNKGTVRGLHFQFPPHAETKLVRVVSGEVFDVVVDLRKGSATFGKWQSFRLSAANKKTLYIPRGFAHGMCTLTHNLTMLYKMDNYYSPESAGAIKWNDPDIGIDWPINNPILNERDLQAPSFRDFVERCGGIQT